MINKAFSGFNLGIITIFLLLNASCSDFLSSIRNENTQEISTLLYRLDDLDVCINGAYGAFCSGGYYSNVQLAELLGSDCATTTLNPSILPVFDAINRDNYFLKYSNNLDNYQAGAFLQWGGFVNNNSNIVLKSIQEKLPLMSTANDTLNANRLMGEALLLRASVEFYNNYFVGRQYHANTQDSLSTLYRRKPFMVTADAAEPRKTVAQVFRFMVTDLKMAKLLLPDKFNNKIHPPAYQFRCKKEVATAMLAKVYFQANKFDSALVEVNELLGNQIGVSPKFPLLEGNSYLEIFQNEAKSNYQTGNYSEVIMAFHGNSAFTPTTTTHWQLFQWTAFQNLQNGDISHCKFNIVLDESLKALWLKGDTAKDLRFKQLVYISANHWKESPAGQWTTLKWAYPTSNIPWLRASEFHLMRAEIYLHQDKLAFAESELNLIRFRAGLPGLVANVSKADLFKEIIDERMREFCFENIRRWDNIRLASLNDTPYGSYLPEPYKSGNIPLGNRKNLIHDTVLNWNSNRLYSPIPINEYLFNPALR